MMNKLRKHSLAAFAVFAWCFLSMSIGIAQTVRKPLYLDPTTGYTREMNQRLDATAHPAVFFQNANVPFDQNVYVTRDGNSTPDLVFSDPVAGTLTLLRTESIVQAVTASQTTSVTGVGTTFTTIVTANITTRGNTRVLAFATATCSNTATPGVNQLRLVQGSTAFGSTGGMSWDGGALSTTGIPQGTSMLGITSTTLTAGTYAFSAQMEATTGTGQCRPGTNSEGSTILLFEVSF